MILNTSLTDNLSIVSKSSFVPSDKSLTFLVRDDPDKNRVLYIDESLWLLDDFALELADTNIYTKPVGLVVETVFVFCDIQDNSGELVVSSSVGNASMVTYSSEITQEFYVSLEDDELIITRADFF